MAEQLDRRARSAALSGKEERVEEEVRRRLLKQPLNDFVPLQLIKNGSEGSNNSSNGFNS